MLADRAHQLGPGQTARLDRFLNVSDFLRSELAPGQKFRCSISDQLAAAPDRPPYHLKTVFACPLLFRDKIILHSGLSCSDLSGKQTMRQRCLHLPHHVTRNLHAEDVVQECYMRAFMRLDGFSGKSKTSTWFSRITINAVLMK